MLILECKNQMEFLGVKQWETSPHFSPLGLHEDTARVCEARSYAFLEQFERVHFL